MFSKFLHRPALAIVISIIILFLGGLSIKTLPISQFPNVAPPTVVVTLAYPGASANVLVDSVLILGAGHQRRPEHALHGLRRHQCR